MSLQKLCQDISCNDPNILEEGSHIGSRIMCPEYSLHVKDIKTYPLSQEERILPFAGQSFLTIGYMVPSNPHLFPFPTAVLLRKAAEPRCIPMNILN